MGKTAVIILLIAVFIGGFFIFYQIRSTEKQIDMKRVWASKTDNQSTVTVTITPIDLSPQSREWKFDVVMDTHSIELDQNLTESVLLIDNKSREYRPLKWEGAKAGGHHREGMLIFASIAPYPKQITLRVRDIGDVERLFLWTLAKE